MGYQKVTTLFGTYFLQTKVFILHSSVSFICFSAKVLHKSQRRRRCCFFMLEHNLNKKCIFGNLMGPLNMINNDQVEPLKSLQNVQWSSPSTSSKVFPIHQQTSFGLSCSAVGTYHAIPLKDIVIFGPNYCIRKTYTIWHREIRLFWLI